MSRRTIAILNEKEENFENVLNIISILTANAIADEITVYTRIGPERFNISHERCVCSGEMIPNDCDNAPKTRNWINSRYSKDCGFLHVIDGSVELLKDPSGFI